MTLPGDGPEPPIPPATTQWHIPEGAPDDAAAPFAPFVARRGAPSEGPSLSEAASAAPAEPPMPWEAELPAPLESGPVVTAEVVAASVPGDVDAWAATLPMETGQALPAWQDEVETVAELSAPPEVATRVAEPAAEAREFPLDAFIIPEDARRIPAGLELTEELQRQIAEEVALRLEALAAQLRTGGLAALLESSPDHEPVDVVLAAVLSGYAARKAH